MRPHLFKTGFTLVLALFSLSASAAEVGSINAPDSNIYPNYRGVFGYLYQLDIPFYSTNRSLDLGMLLFLGTDFQTKTVNLAPQKDATRSLTFGSAPQGYQITHVHGIEVGFAPAATYELIKIPMMAPYAGVVPIVGGRKTFQKWFPPETDLKDLPAVRMPSRASDLKEWKDGDQIIYEGMGGVIFTAGIGSTLTAIGDVKFLAMGQWIMAIQKLGPEVAYVKISKKKLLSLSERIGVATLVLEATQFGLADDGFSFAFRLDTEEGARAYESAIRGNLLPAETLENTGHVKRVLSLHEVSQGHVVTRGFGFPFAAFIGKTRGMIHSLDTIRFHQENEETEANYGIYLNEKMIRGFLLVGRRRADDFYGAHIRTRKFPGTPQETTEDHYWGQYVWAYENEKTPPRKLRHELDYLIQRTGMRDFLDVTIPEEKLGYMHGLFRTTLPQTTVDELMQLAEQEGFEARFEAISNQFIDSYFQSGDDSENLCGPLQRDCIADFREESADQVHKAHEKLLLMTQNKALDPKEFSRNFGELGKIVLKNPFVFKAFLSLPAKYPPEMTYRLEGEKILQYQKTIPVPKASSMQSIGTY